MQRPIRAGPATALVPVSELALALARFVERAYQTVVFAAAVFFSGDVGNRKRRSTGLMHPRMAFGVERYQILLLVATLLAAEFEVVHLQELDATPHLEAPAVALRHLSTQCTVAL